MGAPELGPAHRRAADSAATDAGRACSRRPTMTPPWCSRSRTPTAGLFCNGELGPVGGKNPSQLHRHHGAVRRTTTSQVGFVIRIAIAHTSPRSQTERSSACSTKRRRAAADVSGRRSTTRSSRCWPTRTSPARRPSTDSRADGSARPGTVAANYYRGPARGPTSRRDGAVRPGAARRGRRARGAADVHQGALRRAQAALSTSSPGCGARPRAGGHAAAQRERELRGDQAPHEAGEVADDQGRTGRFLAAPGGEEARTSSRPTTGAPTSSAQGAAPGQQGQGAAERRRVVAGSPAPAPPAVQRGPSEG